LGRHQKRLLSATLARLIEDYPPKHRFRQRTARKSGSGAPLPILTGFSWPFHASAGARRCLVPMFDTVPRPWRDEPDPWRDPALERTSPSSPRRPLPRSRRSASAAWTSCPRARRRAHRRRRRHRWRTRPDTAALPSSVSTAPAGTSTAATDPRRRRDHERDPAGECREATAFAKHDPTVMQATSTAAHYAEM